MSARGAKPKPTRLKVLEGNPGKRPLNKKEPKPDPIAPDCPSYSRPYAKEEWDRMVPELGRLFLASRIDRAMLATYCEAWADWREALEWLQKDQHGVIVATDKGLKAHPAVKIMKDAGQTMRLICAEFGMTPSSRSRMTLPTEEEDDWDGILD